MTNAVHILVVAAGGAFILWLMANAIIDTYFRRKRRFVDELVQKQKEAHDGQG